MLKKFKITYTEKGKEKSLDLEAFSKYDAKRRFYAQHPKDEIVRVEVE